MEINSVRSSSLSQWSDCQLKYWLIYVCGITSESNLKANLGTLVHWCGEQLGRAKKLNRHLKPSKFNDPEYLLAVAWNRFTKQTPDDYTEEHYEFCREQLKNLLDSPSSPLKHEIVDVEKQFELTIKRDGFDNLLLRGTIDLITKYDDKMLEGIDLKTGLRSDWLTGKEKELEDFKDDLQLNVYNLALRNIYRNQFDHVLFTIFYSREKQGFTNLYTEEDAENTLERIRKIYNEILATNVPKRLIDDKRRKSEFFKCKYVCQFGVYGELLYSDGQKTIVVEGKISKPKEIPQAIERDGRTFYFVEVKQSLCRKYHNLMKKHTPELAVPIIQALTIKGKPVSARNDYAAAGIHRGVIE